MMRPRSYRLSRKDILPLHLDLEILGRLPTKSVLRFRCVHKSWNVATRESSFVNSHLSRPTKETTYFVTKLGKGTPKISVGVASDPEGNLFQGAFTTTNWIESRTNPCNGLICFSISTYTSQGARQILSYICNPSSEEYVQLPIVKQAQELHNTYYICGLGFDTHRKVFKVVMFEKVLHQTTSIFLCTVPLDGDPPKPWRRLHGVQVPTIMVPLETVLVNGRLHWLTDNATTNLKCVISWDIHDEQIRLMPFNKIKTNTGCYNIAELRGSLALVNFLEPVPGTMHVWVMNEYGNDDSWTLRVSLPIRYWPSLHGIRFSWETDGFFFVYLASRILSYNPKKQLVVDHNIVGNIKYVVPFHSSLVSLKGVLGRQYCCNMQS